MYGVRLEFERGIRQALGGKRPELTWENPVCYDVEPPIGIQTLDWVRIVHPSLPDGYIHINANNVKRHPRIPVTITARVPAIDPSHDRQIRLTAVVFSI